MKHQHFYFLIVLLLGINISCTGLKHVHDFAVSSNKVIQERAATPPYSYVQYCRDMCNLDKEAQILAGTANFNPLDTLNCNCDKQLSQDRDTEKAYTVLLLYFTGLEKLSSNEHFVYKTEELVAALGKVKAIKDPEMVSPVSKIADVVVGMATHAYRARALRNILNESEEPVDHLLKDLIQSNLILKERYKGYYGRYLNVLSQKYTGSKTIGPKEQLNDYIANRREVDQSKSVYRQIEDFNSRLSIIKAGHLKLAGERLKLKDKELITYLYTQVSELQSNISKLGNHE